MPYIASDVMGEDSNSPPPKNNKRRYLRPKLRKTSNRETGMSKYFADMAFGFFVLIRFLTLPLWNTIKGGVLSMIRLFFIVGIAVGMFAYFFGGTISGLAALVNSTAISTSSAFQWLSQSGMWFTCILLSRGCSESSGPSTLDVIVNITSSATAEVQQAYNIVGTLSVFSETSNALANNAVHSNI